MRVSIVISTHNLESLVAETMEAALSQTHSPCEVVVVDDGSTDGTRRVLSEYEDRARLIFQENFGGPSRPRNVAIRECAGDLIAFCDGDDVMRPDAIARAVEVFGAEPDVDLVWADLEYLQDRDGQPLGRWSERYEAFRVDLQPIDLPGCHRLMPRQAYKWLLSGLFLGTSSVVVRREVLQTVGPFDESLPNGDDREMWLRIARTGHTFAYRDEVAYSYRLRDDALSRRGYRRLPAVISVLERQLPHIDDRELQDIVMTRLTEVRSTYAYGLRSVGHFPDARRVYWRLLRDGARSIGLRGLLLATLRVGRT